MKIKFQILLVVILMLACQISKGQNCEGLAFKKDATYEMETYDSKDKKQGMHKSAVKSLTTNGAKTEAVVHTEAYDAKGKKESDGDVKFICEGDKILMDISSITANNNQMGKNPNMEMEMEGSFLEFPTKLSVGQTLKDGEMKMKMKDKTSGQEMGNSKITFVNRKVEAKETITTPAGTFECYKISTDINMEMTAAGMTLPGMKSKMTIFYNKEVGQVKSQSFNSSGKLLSYSLLTKFTK